MPYISRERGEEFLEEIEFARQCKAGRQGDQVYASILAAVQELGWKLHMTGKADTLQRLESKIKRSLKKQRKAHVRTIVDEADWGIHFVPVSFV
jgi:hypothetical protein